MSQGLRVLWPKKLTIFERNRVLKVIHPISNYDEFRVLPLKSKALPHKLYYINVASPSSIMNTFHLNKNADIKIKILIN